MKFKKFVMEIKSQGSVELSTSLSDIERELGQYNPDELADFGEWLEDELDDDYDVEEDGVLDNYNSIISVINQLDADDLDYILYMMQPASTDLDPNGVVEPDGNIDPDVEYDPNGELTYNNGSEIGEGVAIKFKAKNFNKIKTKRFTLSKAKFRAQKAARKKDNRANRAARRQNYRKNKIKIKKYEKSYNAAIKAGKHFKKIRR